MSYYSIQFSTNGANVYYVRTDNQGQTDLITTVLPAWGDRSVFAEIIREYAEKKCIH